MLLLKSDLALIWYRCHKTCLLNKFTNHLPAYEIDIEKYTVANLILISCGWYIVYKVDMCIG